MANQLEERGHHAVSHGPVDDSDHTPDKGCGVPGLEAQKHQSSGYCVVVQAFTCVVFDILLDPSELAEHAFKVCKGEHQHAVLQALLHVLLEFAFTGADACHQLPELAEEHLGAENGRDHEYEQNPEQPGRQVKQVHGGRDQLDGSNHHAGNAAD